MLYKVSCPAEAIDVVEVREGNEAAAHKSPGLYHAGDVTLCGDKRLMKPILDWFGGIKSGTLTNFRKNLTLQILGTNVEGKVAPICTFTLFRAWPHQLNWAPDGTVCIQLAVEDTELANQ